MFLRFCIIFGGYGDSPQAIFDNLAFPSSRSAKLWKVYELIASMGSYLLLDPKVQLYVFANQESKLIKNEQTLDMETNIQKM